MKTFITSALIAVLFSACSHRNLQEVSTTELQNKMHEIDKTDYAKIEGKHKEKTESKRQSKYHSYANETDKKLNHRKNEDLNKKKGWDGSFNLY